MKMFYSANQLLVVNLYKEAIYIHHTSYYTIILLTVT